MPETETAKPKKKRTLGPLRFDWTKPPDHVGVDGEAMESSPFQTEKEAVAWLKANGIDGVSYRLQREIWTRTFTIERRARIG